MDKKIERAHIGWARRMEKYIQLIRKDKLKDEDVEALLDDLNLSNQSFIVNDRIKSYCVTKKGFLLKALKESYKSQDAVAKKLNCSTFHISLNHSDKCSLSNEGYKYALWSDDLTVPEQEAEILEESTDTADYFDYSGDYSFYDEPADNLESDYDSESDL